jgi:hypothetical protein
MDKLTKMGLLATIILALSAGITGVFEFLFTYHIEILIFQLNSTILMIGMSLGMISTFFEERRKIWIHASVLSIILGECVIAVIWGYKSPIQVVGPGVLSFNFEFLLMDFIDLLFSNSLGSFVVILASPTIIIPYVLLSIVTAKISFIMGVVAFHGFKGVILMLGWLHIYPEFYAIFSACLAGIRVALKSFESFLQIRKKGFRSSLGEIKNVMMHELRSTMPKVLILLVIAALLETLWAPFWINYWLSHIL